MPERVDDGTHFYVSHGMGGYPRPDPGAQDLAMDVGKIHRLMADGTVPADNPVFAGASGPSSIWSYGHRDPQGLYFDAGSPDPSDSGRVVKLSPK